MVADVEGESVLVSAEGRRDDGRYEHPAKSKVFSFDHLRRAVEEVEVRHRGLWALVLSCS